jgi:hypothetical protein
MRKYITRAAAVLASLVGAVGLSAAVLAPSSGAASSNYGIAVTTTTPAVGSSVDFAVAGLTKNDLAPGGAFVLLACTQTDTFGGVVSWRQSAYAAPSVSILLDFAPVPGATEADCTAYLLHPHFTNSRFPNSILASISFTATE